MRGWPRCPRGISGAIVGARRPGQVDEWLPAVSLELDDSDLDEISKAIIETGAGQGPSHPCG
ncbi:hypothetical protein ACIBHX_34905 [Nonomuraea sp. NPDC050536]|uniref:hypothetical protein n=1 Tax=Nonomuraea sp. NPDC050536 TaxID=3364366 RepID=UPI0037C51018